MIKHGLRVTGDAMTKFTVRGYENQTAPQLVPRDPTLSCEDCALVHTRRCVPSWHVTGIDFAEKSVTIDTSPKYCDLFEPRRLR